VGGDIELSELLGYAGDSRIVADPIAGSDYLDGVGNGLLAPKIAVEFDMQTNGDPVDYCVDINTIRQNTRKDPLSGDKDAVQYVYWGNTILDIDCRGDHPSYDDNRHNAEVGAGSSDWEYDANAPVFSSPALDPGDGTIYFGSGSSDYPTGDFHAVHPDGTEKWVIKKGNYVKSSPAVGSDGTIYFGSNKFYAIKPDGTEKWPPHTLDGSVSASPAIAADGTIYIGSNGSNDAKLYAFNPDGTEAWNFPLDGAGDGDNDIDSPIIVDNAGGGTIYVGSDNDFLYAVNPDGTLKWKFDTGADVESGAAVDRTGGPHDGTTYVGSENGLFYGIQPDGTEKWVHNLGGAVFSTPAVGADGTIYVGSNSNKLYALNPATHIPDWEFLTGGDVRSSPTIGPSGTIYFGSHDNKLYAVNPDGIEIWQFVTFGDVVTKPALKEDGTIYIGVANESTVEGKLYSISDIASPPNFRNLLITSTGVNPNFQVGGEDVKLDDPDDWLAGESLKGPWAVRMEIKRSLTANNGRYEYTLRTWIRQCATVIASSECDDPSIIGTFFQDTRLEYDAKPPHLTQTIELDLADHVLFERFLFGFTGASGDTSGAGMTPQHAVIEKLQLSFIRPGDPVVTTDTNW
jgi:outer membrane protein assembly factor BamB